MELTTDQDLILRIRAGDERAFEEAVAEHASGVRRHVAGIVRDDAATEDITQEVLIRLWTRAADYGGSGPLRAWLIRVATNLALNHLRSARRRRSRPLSADSSKGAEAGPEVEEFNEPDWLIAPTAQSPTQAAETTERNEMLQHLVDDLPDDHRQVFRLAREEEMALADVAEELGIPVGTVKSRLHHATRELRRLWDEIYGK